MTIFKNGSLTRNASWVFLGQGLSAVCQGTYFVLLARLLGKVEYGIYAGAFAMVAILSAYSSLGSPLVLLRHVSPDHRRFATYWGNVLIITPVLGIVFIILLAWGGPHVSPSYSWPLVVCIAFADCLCAQLTIAAGQAFQAFEKLRMTASFNLLVNFLRSLLAGLMLWRLHHATARQWAVAALAASLIAAASALLFVTRFYGKPSFSTRLLSLRVGEGLIFALSGSTAGVYNNIDKAMLGHYGMNAANGIYTMAYRVIDVACIPVTSVSSAAFPRFFQKGVGGIQSTAGYANQLIKRTAPIAMLSTLAMLLAAPIIPHMIGHGFDESVQALRWLCLLPVFRSLHSCAADALTGAGHQKLRLGNQTTVAGFNFAVNLYLIPHYGWRGAAWSSLATDGLLAVLNWTTLAILRVQATNLAIVPTLRQELNLMRISYCLRQVSRVPHRIYWEVRSWIFPIPTLCHMWLINRYGRMPLTQANGLVVSLTSYGKRIRTVYLAIESIGRGRLRPSRIILWLDDRTAFENPPATIRRLVQRGLEVKLCDNYGPHKKYYPYLQSLQTFEAPLVTADDDVFYPRGWLKELDQAFQQCPDVVNCYRAHIMTINERGIGKYENWGLATSTKPSVHHVATGVAGVLYPPAFLRSLKNAGNGFVDSCLKSDDVWLHVQAVRAGYKVRQIRPQAFLPLSIPGAESIGLWKSNIFGGNDRQIASTYTAKDIQELSLVHE
jgi:O-antigen/teichoic acid export membrane protein